jgi:ABC-type nitrate/sulfonate/bicarbonate transport system substrate-binding protein
VAQVGQIVQARGPASGLLRFLICSLALLNSAPRALAQSRAADQLVVSYAGITGGRAPLWIAKELRLFEKYGLDTRLVHITAGTTSINALIAGDVDMAITTSSAAIAAAARGAPLAIIATNGSPAYKLLAHPTITAAAQLKGKTVGSSQLGSGADFALRKLLPKLGLTPGQDVTILPTGLSESHKRILLMFQGRIDATLGTVENVLQLELSGQKVNVLADLKDMGVYVSGTDFSATHQFLKTASHKAKAFLKAFCEAIWLGINNKEIVAGVFRKYLKVENPKLLDAMHQSYFVSGNIPLKPYPVPEVIQSDLEYLSIANPTLRGKKPADLTDTTLLREMESEGFFDRLQR